MKRKIIVFLAVMLLAVLLSGCNSSSSDRGDLKAVLVTDVHFDPFKDPALVPLLDAAPWQEWEHIFERGAVQFPAWGKSCDYTLLTSLQDDMAQLARPDLMIFCGDILAHHFKDNYAQITGHTDDASVHAFILKTVSYVMNGLASVYPDCPLFFTLGNNDSYAGDYLLEDNGAFLADTAEPLYQLCLKNQVSKSGFLDTYAKHGYYSLQLPGLDNVRLISMNSVFMSAHYPDSNGTTPASAEFVWLESELAKARDAGEKVWLLTHIPPGIDVYKHLHPSSGECGVPPTFMRAQYNSQYISLLQNYEDIISFVMAGHTHMDDFRLVFSESEDERAVEVVMISPGVTPLFGQNPAFRVLRVDRENGIVEDVQTRFLNLPVAVPDPEWETEYSFLDKYGVEPGVSGVEIIYSSMAQDEQVRQNYVLNYSVSRTPSLIETAWPWYRCGMGSLTPEEYQQNCPCQ